MHHGKRPFTGRSTHTAVPLHHGNTRAFTGHGTPALGGLQHGTTHLSGQGTNKSAAVTRGQVGQITHGKYQGRALSHQVLGNRRRGLVGKKFRTPGNQLRGRLTNLQKYQWRQRFKRVVIVSAFGGGLICGVYCTYDVPVDVYGAFVEAVAEAGDEQAEAASYAQDEAAFASVPPEELPRVRVARARGWNKAVAILEEAAADEEKKAAEATKNGETVEIVVDQPDEQVDVVVDDAAAAKKSVN